MRPATDRPNIILINCDDLGYGDLGCYGATVNRTPVLDRLAAEGVQLTDFYMASCVCSPSRGAMMTGCYPARIGFGSFEGRWVLFPGQGVGMNRSEITMASILRAQGYATFHVGKWHCGDQPEFLPTRHGFDDYYGIPYSNDMGRAGGRDYPPLPLMRNEEVLQAQPDQCNIIERYTEQSVRFLRDHRDEPFFLYLAHMQVHLPLYAPKRFLAQSINGRYGACVEAVDWSTAVLLAELRRLGIEENTLVIFTSDNGSRGCDGGCNLPLRGHKGTTWEGGQRVPCILRWPGQLAAGQRCDALVSSMDFLPTFASLAGTTAPSDRLIDGCDVSGLLRGDSDQSARETFYFHHMNALCAVRDRQWKLHVLRGNETVCELYDLRADVAETTDVSAAHPDVVKALMKHVDACRRDIGDSAVEATGENCRPIGQVDTPKPLTTFDSDDPYIEAEYDLADAG